MRASGIKAATAEFQRYSSAVEAFRGKYMSLPGDMSNATAFWGDDTTLCDDGNATNNGSPGTCNGDGDRTIEAPGAASATGETFQFFKQLALAGMIEGGYSGAAGSGWATQAVRNTNVPSSKVRNAGWGIQYLGVYAGDGTLFALDYGNAFVLGGFPTASGFLSTPVLQPIEAWSIDDKLDDGRPGYGHVIASDWAGTCSAADDGGNANNDLAASYRKTDNEQRCTLYFVRAM